MLKDIKDVSLMSYPVLWAGARSEEIAYWRDVFTPDECAEIVTLFESDCRMSQGHAGDDVNQSIRNCKARYVYPGDDTMLTKIFPRLAYFSGLCNAQFFHKDWNGLEFYDGVMMAMYRGGEEHGEGEHYKAFHSDRRHDVPSYRTQRVLSLSVQLSDPTTYDGGDLVLRPASGETTADRTQGHMTIFQSFIEHKVTPVTRGARYSLVAWIGGED